MFQKVLILIALIATPALGAPRVVTDIAPVHSLVALVMRGVGAPVLLLDAQTSPHNASLRPKQAHELQKAEVVFWIGPELTPWLERPLQNLAGDSLQIALTQNLLNIQLHLRHEHGAHEEEDLEALDPHLWLDPQNAKNWLDLFATELARLDPKNASRYRANAALGKAELNALTHELQSKLTPLRDRQFLVFHDGYQYFEARFNLATSGAISLGDAAAPSAAAIQKVRNMVAHQNVICVFSEPQFNAGLVDTVIDGFDVKTAILDPLGQTIPPGANLYGQLLRNMAQNFEDCLGT